MQNIQKLNTSDKMLILKATANISEKILKENAQFILNQLLKKDEFYKSNFGKLIKRSFGNKTVKETLEKKQKDLIKLQREIEMLKALSPDSLYKEAELTLVNEPSDLANETAMDLLATLLEGLDSKRLTKIATKLAASKR